MDRWLWYTYSENRESDKILWRRPWLKHCRSKKEIKGLEKVRQKLITKNEKLSIQLEKCLEREINLRSIMQSTLKERESLNLSRFSLFIAFCALAVSVFSGQRFIKVEDNSSERRTPALKSPSSNSVNTDQEDSFPLNLKNLNQRIP